MAAILDWTRDRFDRWPIEALHLDAPLPRRHAQSQPQARRLRNPRPQPPTPD